MTKLHDLTVGAWFMKKPLLDCVGEHCEYYHSRTVTLPPQNPFTPPPLPSADAYKSQILILLDYFLAIIRLNAYGLRYFLHSSQPTVHKTFRPFQPGPIAFSLQGRIFVNFFAEQEDFPRKSRTTIGPKFVHTQASTLFQYCFFE